MDDIELGADGDYYPCPACGSNRMGCAHDEDSVLVGRWCLDCGWEG
jgi:predicted RNA-binding Zn-ribbon protein involved in translation (DUF1610 family)